jgi:hypothetical protein
MREAPAARSVSGEGSGSGEDMTIRVLQDALLHRFQGQGDQGASSFMVLGGLRTRSRRAHADREQSRKKRISPIALYYFTSNVFCSMTWTLLVGAVQFATSVPSLLIDTWLPFAATSARPTPHTVIGEYVCGFPSAIWNRDFKLITQGEVYWDVDSFGFRNSWCGETWPRPCGLPGIGPFNVII